MQRRRLRRSALSAVDVLSCRKLYAAVLEDAMTTLSYPFQHLQQQMRMQVSGGDAQRNELIYARVEKDRQWVLSDDDSQPFSFVRCCTEMDLNPDAVRDAFRRKGLLAPPPELVAKGRERPRNQRLGGWAARKAVA